MEVLGYFGAFLIGIALGLLGGGGAILAVPLFVYFFKLPPTLATSYSLLVVGVASAVGFFRAQARGEVHLRAGLLFALPSFVGVLLVRRWLLPNIPAQWNFNWSFHSWTFTKDALVLSSFAVVMLLAAIAMLRPMKKTAAPESGSAFVFKALTVGGITGFVGAGGGFLIVPSLVLLRGLSMRVAVGTSLGVIALNSLLGFGNDVLAGVYLDDALLLTVTLLAVSGIFLGSHLGKKVSEQKLKPAFGVFVLVLGSFILIQQLLR